MDVVLRILAVLLGLAVVYFSIMWFVLSYKAFKAILQIRDDVKNFVERSGE